MSTELPALSPPKSCKIIRRTVFKDIMGVISTQSVPFLTPDQYLEIERAAETRSEYLDGAMHGGGNKKPRPSRGSDCRAALRKSFRYYRALPSFREYLLLAQSEVRAEHDVCQPDGAWLMREYSSLADEIDLPSIACRLRLQDIYERVELS